MTKSKENRYCVLFITAATADQAREMAQTLVEDRLVACANVLPPMQSIFRWQGKICRETEALIVAKSLKSHVQRIVEEVKQLHSYDVPEIIALPITGGSPEYLRWIDEVLGEGASSTQ